MNRYKKKAAFCSSLLLVCILFLNIPAFASNEETLCLQFIEQKLQSDGGVFTNYLPSREKKDWAAGHSVLSESQGLMLKYYVRTGNRDGAAKAIAFVQEHLDTGSILSYRLDEDLFLYKVNAAVDDLRLTGAMLEAADTFNQPEYRDLALAYAGRLYQTNVRGQMLSDFYDEQYRQAGRISTLCYADLDTMKKLAVYDERWLPVMENMRNTVLNGFLGDAFPMFQTRYNLESRQYESESIQMAESLLTAYHLSKAGSCPEQTVEYLKKTLRSDRLYSVYDLNGAPESSTESTAIYALCALMGAQENDAELYRAAINHMLSFQVLDQKSPVYGAFADAGTLQAFSFDNLLALLALQAGKAQAGEP